jgi:hypothetical protein
VSCTSGKNYENSGSSLQGTRKIRSVNKG